MPQHHCHACCRIILQMILGLGWILSNPVWAISRIGTSSIGEKVLLSAEEEEKVLYRAPILMRPYGFFPFSKPLPNQQLQIWSQNLSTHQTGEPYYPSLTMTPFHSAFPSLIQKSRTDLIHSMLIDRPKWKALKAVDPCILSYFYLGSNFSTGFATWGDGQGFAVASAGNSYYEIEALEALITQVELIAGICAWN